MTVQPPASPLMRLDSLQQADGMFEANLRSPNVPTFIPR